MTSEINALSVAIMKMTLFIFRLSGNLSNRFNPAYDIAVIVLEEEVATSATIEIAHLPSEDAPCPAGRSLIISGWGKDKMRPFRSLEKLWAVSQECLDLSSCPRLTAGPGVNPKTNMICVGDSENPLNSGCVGDSGGNLNPNLRVYSMNAFSYY